MLFLVSLTLILSAHQSHQSSLWLSHEIKPISLSHTHKSWASLQDFPAAVKEMNLQQCFGDGGGVLGLTSLYMTKMISDKVLWRSLFFGFYSLRLTTIRSISAHVARFAFGRRSVTTFIRPKTCLLRSEMKSSSVQPPPSFFVLRQAHSVVGHNRQFHYCSRETLISYDGPMFCREVNHSVYYNVQRVFYVSNFI